MSHSDHSHSKSATQTGKPKFQLRKDRWYGTGWGALLGLLTLPYYLVYVLMVDKDDSNAWYLKGWGAFLAYVFLPLFVIWYVWVKKPLWSKTKKFAITIPLVTFMVIFVIAAIFAPPTVELSSMKPDKPVTVETGTHTLTGKIYPYGAVTTINGKQIALDEQGKFETTIDLQEGDNTITVRAVDGDKVTEKTYKIHRIAAAELAERARLQKEAETKTQKVSEVKPAPPAPPHDPENYWHQVTSVIDGDTLKARVDGKEVAIRVIGVDAPEPQTQQPECYSAESSAKAKEFLSGKWIKIQSDKTQTDKDQYDRLLRYVYFDQGTDFGKRMIEEGYAYEYTYSGKAYSHQTDYKSMQEHAKSKSHGVWSKDTCNGQRTKPTPVVATPPPTPQPVAAPAPAQTPPPSNNVYYANCSQVRAAGAAPIYRGQPGYRSALDRDNDGVACET